MRIIHLSYARIKEYNDPDLWLKRINFYTGLLDALAKHAHVKSFHCISFDGALVKNAVEYQFLNIGFLQYLFPFKLHAHVKEWKPDVVIVHGLIFPWQLLLFIFQMKRHVKIFVQHHAERPLSFPKNILQRIADRYVSIYFFTSIDLAKPWLTERQINSASKICELMEVSSVFDIQGKKDPSNLKTYLWVGRFDDNKDPLTLVEAFIKFLSSAPEAKLIIVFKGGYLKNILVALIKDQGVESSIQLVENVEHAQMGSWFMKCNYIISTSHYEGSGTAVCEAMSCGCIPILTDIPSFRMMTQQGNIGLLFKAGDVSGLTNALLRSLKISQAEEREKVIRHFQEHLSFEAVSKKVIKIIESIDA